MSKPKIYIVTLKHDRGQVNVYVSASSKANAILQALHIENAPLNAVSSVVKK